MDKKAAKRLLEKALSNCPQDKNVICIRDRHAYVGIGEEKENKFESYLISLVSGNLEDNTIVASFKGYWCMLAFKKDTPLDLEAYEEKAFRMSSEISCHISYF